MTLRVNLTCAVSVLLAAAAVGAAAFELDERTNEVVLRTLTGFDRCVLDLAETPACLDALRRYANKRPNDSFQAGKRARLHYAAWTALPFFEIAFRKKATDAQCGDEDVLLAVIAGLSRPESDQASIGIAKDIVADKCWDEIQEGLIEAANEDASPFRSNACPLLIAKGLSIPQCEQQPAVAGGD